MSRKHHQRTRAEIMAKRRAEDGMRYLARAKMPHKHLSKYEPHFGAKQQEKLQNSLVRAAMRQAA